MTTIAPINIKIHQIGNDLPAHVPRGGYVQPGDSFGGSSLGGDPPRRPPFNPHVK